MGFGPSMSHSGEIPSLFGTLVKGSGNRHTLRVSVDSRVVACCPPVLPGRSGQVLAGSEVLECLVRLPACALITRPDRANARPIAVAPGWSSVWLAYAVSPLPLPGKPEGRSLRSRALSRLGVSVRHAIEHRASLRTTGHSGLLSPSALRFHAPPAYAGQALHLGGYTCSSLTSPGIPASLGYALSRSHLLSRVPRSPPGFWR